VGQVGRYLRSVTNGYAHYCPGCELMHAFAVDVPLGNGARWTFNGDLEKPTFNPSMNIGSDWCHYNLVNGELRFSTCNGHKLGGTTMLLPELPPEYRDKP
jgi:hypothetical protein